MVLIFQRCGCKGIAQKLCLVSFKMSSASVLAIESWDPVFSEMTFCVHSQFLFGVGGGGTLCYSSLFSMRKNASLRF